MESHVKKDWDKKAKARYSEMLNDIKYSKEKPDFMEEVTYLCWKQYWESPDVKRISEQNSKNRKTGSIDGSTPSTHTGGSASHYQRARRLAAELNRKAYPRELYLRTHKRRVMVLLLSTKSLRMLMKDKISDELAENLQSNEEVDGDNLFFKSVGGMSRKRCIYGLGSQVAEYYQGSS